MAERDDWKPGQVQRGTERRRWQERPMHWEGPRHRGDRHGYAFWGPERGYNQGGYGGRASYERGYDVGSYDWKLERAERQRGRPPRGYQRSDERIHEEVCEQLMEGPVDVGDVEVTVDNGEVTLSGWVDERWEKRAIEDIAAHVRGVHDVHNRVRMRSRQEEAKEARSSKPSEEPEHMGT
ncbi:MAG TPA: BON domain-containing protein [Myxococcaceae bacterium]|nr:BON domain-containing protein [Myxococcaceae bacterium]